MGKYEKKEIIKKNFPNLTKSKRTKTAKQVSSLQSKAKQSKAKQTQHSNKNESKKNQSKSKRNAQYKNIKHYIALHQIKTQKEEKYTHIYFTTQKKTKIMTTMNNSPVVVFDNGSFTSRLGYAGMMEPEVVVASAIGTKRTTKKGPNGLLDEMSYQVGSHTTVLEQASTHDFNFMIRNGLIQDWDALERLWHSCIYEKLRCNPEDHPFLISESPFNTPENREQMAEILFETYNIPGLYIGMQPILSLVASWGSVNSKTQQLSGTVVDSGDGTTTIIPVADGHILRGGIQQIPLGGRDITSYVQERLRQNGRNLPPSKSYEIARIVKEKYGYVCSNLEKERNKASSASSSSLEQQAGGKCSNQDTWSCSIGEEKYLAGEVLFQPSLLKGLKARATPLPELVDSTIQLCPIDIRRSLYNNVVLSGGTTMFPDFGRRLQRDIKRIVNHRLRENRSAVNIQTVDTNNIVDVNVVSHSSQSHSAWLGGSIVASDIRFHSWLKTKEQYDEEGPRIARHSVGVFS